jgi:metallophosphoesterase (TIGR00282 family)
MKVAFIGDIVGRAGRHMVRDHLKKIREEFEIDLVVANYENASHGFGLTKKNGEELLSYGVDVMTGGNHTFDRSEINHFKNELPILIPANFPSKRKNLYSIFNIGGKRIAILNLLGSQMMPVTSDNPFPIVLEILDELKNSDEVDHILFDFHAETTAEKRAMFHMLKGKVSMVVGTHTHIATDDYTLSNGTFYITDIGLTGCFDNNLGMDSEIALQRYLTGEKRHMKVPEPNQCFKVLQMVVADFETNKGFSYKVFQNGETHKRDVFKI